MTSTRAFKLTGALVAGLTLLLLPAAASAQVDTSRYVALGDSLTAAFTSGGLIETAQANSYPALIKRQAGGGTFEQPLVTAPGIPPLLELVSIQPLVIAPRAPLSQAGFPKNLNLPRPYDNLAVPGFRVGDVLRTVTGNTIIDIILRGLGTQLQQAQALQPTFVTLWIGNNDVLGAATSGIVIDGVTLTPAGQFQNDLNAIFAALGGVDGAIATIPDVTAIPFVTTLPPVLINPATNEPVLVNGQPVPLIGPNGPLGPGDNVLLTASGALAQGFGIPVALGGNGQPLGTEFILDANETATINARVRQINNAIRSAAQAAGWAVVDINGEFGRIAAEGLSIGGIDYSTDFLTGGLFSYDGVHASAFGYAYVANEFIRAINEHYGADIPLVDLFRFTFEPDLSAVAGLSRGAVQQARVTPAATENLRRTLRVPPTPVLKRLLAQGGGKGGPGVRPNGPGGPAPPRSGPPEGPGGGGEPPATPQAPGAIPGVGRPNQ